MAGSAFPDNDPPPDDPCYPDNPCLNGGVCTNVDGENYVCDCQPGFSGTNCEHSKNLIIILHHYRIQSYITREKKGCEKSNDTLSFVK